MSFPPGLCRNAFVEVNPGANCERSEQERRDYL